MHKMTRPASKRQKHTSYLVGIRDGVGAACAAARGAASRIGTNEVGEDLYGNSL